MIPPETRYAKSGPVHIAYQVLGHGPFDLVFVPGFFSHVEYAWEDPAYARFLQQLASFARLIWFDKRGTGLSDRVELATLEQRMDDIRAVMDAVGSARAVVFGTSEGGLLSALFAATYPERTVALVLFGSLARYLRDSEYPFGTPPERYPAMLDEIEQHWGSGAGLEIFAPSVADDARFRHWYARFCRLSASPGGAAAVWRLNRDLDIRPVLPTIHVPTLVLHRTGDLACGIRGGRYLAEHIPGAKFVELPGVDHMWWVGDTVAMLDEVEEFLTGARQGVEPDRVLATILFTDIVGSTERAVEAGDRRWRDLLDSHHTAVRRELARFRGREVKTTGDGFLATFDGPARAIRCACALRDAVQQLGLPIRSGLHTGECELMGDDIGGIAVHIGQRVSALARPGEVLVSGTVKDLVAGSGLRFEERGLHTLKGLPDAWRLFAVAS